MLHCYVSPLKLKPKVVQVLVEKWLDSTKMFSTDPPETFSVTKFLFVGNYMKSRDGENLFETSFVNYFHFVLAKGTKVFEFLFGFYFY